MLDTKLPIWVDKLKIIPFLSRIVYQGHIIHLLPSIRSPVCTRGYFHCIRQFAKQFVYFYLI